MLRFRRFMKNSLVIGILGILIIIGILVNGTYINTSVEKNYNTLLHRELPKKDNAEFNIVAMNTEVILNESQIAIVTVEYTLNLTQASSYVDIRVDATHLSNTAIRDENGNDLVFNESAMRGYIILKVNFYNEQVGIVKFTLFYVTSDYVSKIPTGYLFQYYFTTIAHVDNFDFILRLPKNGKLMEPVSGPSIFPTPHENWTDGSYFYFRWEYHNIPEGMQGVITAKYIIVETTSEISTKMAENSFKQLFSLLLGVAVAIAMSFGVITLQGHLKRKEREKIIDWEDFLSDNEKTIIKYIIEKGGKTNQAEIVWDLKMSKASVSMVLNSLEKKNLIRKERRGRLNFIYVTEKLKKLYNLET